jgi:hypothetical protein
LLMCHSESGGFCEVARHGGDARIGATSLKPD